MACFPAIPSGVPRRTRLKASGCEASGEEDVAWRGVGAGVGAGVSAGVGAGARTQSLLDAGDSYGRTHKAGKLGTDRQILTTCSLEPTARA